ncbi:MAG: FtsW/RodA/SpoVE family cell cycle protein, partial [Pseudomonadota bacterium]
MTAAVMTSTTVRAAGKARPVWDYWLLGSVCTLLALGVVMVHSASVAYAAREMHNSIYFLVRHASYVVLGLLLMAFVMRTRVRWWEKAGPYLLLLGIVSLVVVLVPGISAHINGSS